MSIFGWSLPPGCTQRHIDEAFGVEGPLDCPICNDGVELDGPDCPVQPLAHGVTCPKHGCIVCGDLEKQRPLPEPEYVDIASDLADEDQLVFADLDANPENVRVYSPGIVAKWRAARGK